MMWFCPFTRNDPQSGAYSITPPSIGSQCLYTEILGEVIIIALFLRRISIASLIKIEPAPLVRLLIGRLMIC